MLVGGGVLLFLMGFLLAVVLGWVDKGGTDAPQ